MNETFKNVLANYRGLQDKTVLEFAKCGLDGMTINPEEYITELELPIVYLQKLDIQIDYSVMMTHIL